MENLIKKVSEFITKTAIKAADEFSYQTGIGWKYELNDRYKDRMSRRLQRSNVSPNNMLYRADF